MHSGTFGRMGAACTRRGGIRAMLGALGLAIPGSRLAARSGAGDDLAASAGAAGAAARSRKPRPQGPCGDGSRKDNICTKNSQCCTGVCTKSLGKKNIDGKGRCRCIRRGKPCKQDRNCCNSVCSGGICGSTLIPTGQPCVAGDQCEAANATCTRYFQSTPAGTYCLLPNAAACSAGTDCASGVCNGACIAETCDVCANGCPYTAVQAAITGMGADATIRIDAGTYTEDITISQNVTLSNCNGSAVTLKNLIANGRTITTSGGAAVTATVRNITVTASDDTTTVNGGGIYADSNLTLSGETVVTNCRLSGGIDSGGGVHQYKQLLTMRDAAAVRNNDAGYGAGVYADYEAGVVMQDDAEISGNTAAVNGAGIYIYGDTPDLPCLHMSGNARIINNSASKEGGAVHMYDPASYTVGTGPSIELLDHALISGNTVTDGESGGGIFHENSSSITRIAGNARITGNSAGATGSGGGILGGVVEIADAGSVSGNTPDNCQGTTGSTCG